MELKKQNIIIIGSGDETGLLAMKIAELKIANPNCEVVTIEEAKKRGLTQTFEITRPNPLAEIEQVYLKDNLYGYHKSARNKRREAERKTKKRKRY